MEYLRGKEYYYRIKEFEATNCCSFVFRFVIEFINHIASLRTTTRTRALLADSRLNGHRKRETIEIKTNTK